MGPRAYCLEPKSKYCSVFRRGSQLTLLVLGLIVALNTRPSAQAGYAAYVVDAGSGTVLHARNSQVLNFPASLCKVMTLYMVFKGLDEGVFTFSSKVPISQRAARQPPSKIGLKAGDSIALEDAILALTTKSANDIASAVAEFISGSEPAFAELMTQQAHILGMQNTTFRNASGLPNRKQRTTARDLGLLGIALYKNFPRYVHYFAHKNFRYRGRTYRNHNNLLGVHKGVEGIKTGYIRASGYNLMVSARYNRHHIIAVVLGGKSAQRRDAQMRRLLDRAYIRFERSDKLFATVSIPPRKPLRNTENNTHSLNASQIAVAHATDIVTKTLTDHVAVANAIAGDIDDKTWGIQLGAFSQHDAAERALDSVVPWFPDLLANTRREISTVTDPIGTLYRARHIGLTEAAARALCDKLTTTRAQECIISPPSPTS